MKKIGERFKISDRLRKILWVLAATAVIMTVTADCADHIVTESTGIAENITGNTADDMFDKPKFYNPQLYAWWGTLYPEFCFEKGGDTDETKPVKLSFWLAKALDW